MGAYRGIIFFLISTTSFTIVNVLVKKLGGNLPVHELIFFRSIFSLAFSLIYLRSIRVSPWGNNKLWLFIRGAVGTIALVMFFYTIVHMPLASATTIQYLSLVFTVLLAVFINGQKVNPWQWLCFALAFAGVVLIKGFDPNLSLGMLGIAILAAIGSGVAYNAVIRCRDTDHPMVVVLWFPLIATPVMLVWCLFDWVMPQGIEWLFLLAIGVFTQVAQWFMTMGLKTDLASRVMPVNYVGSVYAVVLGYWIFDEVLSAWAFVGIGLVVLGVLSNTVISGRQRAKKLA